MVGEGGEERKGGVLVLGGHGRAWVRGGWKMICFFFCSGLALTVCFSSLLKTFDYVLLFYDCPQSRYISFLL